MVDRPENIYEYSYHKMLNTILSGYNNKAGRAGVRFDACVEHGCVLGYKQDIDLVTMLGNILDHAFCAASQMGERGKLLSTKKASGIHGVGIVSVSRMAKKYGGYWEYYIEDWKFNAILVLLIHSESIKGTYEKVLVRVYHFFKRV